MPSSQKKDAEKDKWIQLVGAYWYYSLILAHFNPVLALQIFDNTADFIAESFVSKLCHDYRPDKAQR